MLGYLLAVLVGTGSVGLYVAAFFFPAIHRKSDFIWGGVGLFYALALWIYDKELSGGILVGQVASVALLGWFGWQTIRLRQLVPIDWQTAPPISKKPEWTRTKTATSPETTETQQPTSKKTSSVRAATPTNERHSSPTPPASTSTPKHTVERGSIAPKSTPKSATGNPVVRGEDRTAPATPPSAKANIPDSKIEPDEAAWIRLEVKPSPDSASPVRSVRQSTPPVPPQPNRENIQSPPQSLQTATPSAPAKLPSPPPPAPTSTQSTPAVQPPPPPPAKSPSSPHVKPDGTEVITISFPAPTALPAQQSSVAPSPSATPNPTPAKTPANSPPTPAPPSPPVAKNIQEPPLEQSGDLDKLIAELESEI
jgi:Ycf66 protein N-terminus